MRLIFATRLFMAGALLAMCFARQASGEIPAEPRQAFPADSQQAVFEQAEPRASNGERNKGPLALPPPRSHAGDDAPNTPASGTPSLTTVFGSLGIVLSIFLGVIWVLKRSGHAGFGVLPRDVVSVLGRSSLAPRTHVHLVRLGNKLVLVSISPTGVETLTEVTDPTEVEQIMNQCHGRKNEVGAARHSPRRERAEAHSV